MRTHRPRSAAPHVRRRGNRSRPPKRAGLLVAVALSAAACGNDLPDHDQLISMLTDESLPAEQRMTDDQAQCVWDNLHADGDALATLNQDSPDSEARSRATRVIERCLTSEDTSSDPATNDS